MALPDFTMRELLEAGVHFGHQTRRWNPKMGRYIFGDRNGVHILDLQQTVPLLHQALVALNQTAASGGRVLFVGTKRQAQQPIADASSRTGQYYVNHRWLGGMMTNWKAVSGSIKTLNELNETLSQEEIGLTKKETLQLTRKRDKLERALGGIKEMGGLPDIIIVIDTNKEEIAIHEARKLGIPVIAILDSNSNPDLINFPIPGNDDAIRAINLYCDLFARAILDGLQQEIVSSSEDIGASATGLKEELPESPETKENKVESSESESTIPTEAGSTSEEENSKLDDNSKN